MTWNQQGCTREVFLTRQWAIKVPKLTYGWKYFLRGLLANLQEVEFSKAGWPELCPIVFSLPLGFLVIMPRTKDLEIHEWEAMDIESFLEKEYYVVPAEAKIDSCGWFNGKLVAVDYGS